MTNLDTDSLLADVSAESPCGEDLAAGPLRELLLAAEGTRGGMVGDEAAAGPDWREVRAQASDLFTRTKDLRLAIVLCKAWLHTEGVAGLDAGLLCLRRLVERHWAEVHPRLDPEDNNDPTMRLFILRELCDREGVLGPVRRAPLVSVRQLGSFGLRDLLLATGELKLPEGSTEALQTKDVIDAAFSTCEIGPLRATAAAIQSCLAHLAAIEAQVTERVGSEHTLRLAELREVLQRMDRVVGQAVAARPDAAEPSALGGNGAPGAEERRAISGQVSSREDVIRMLDKICEYYDRHEPSSPVPVLLRRCKRLVPMQFKDIVADLVPDGFSQFEVIRGPDKTGDA
jgi:type VI secretion system protein ImpA